jgi:hypothetical protein
LPRNASLRAMNSAHASQGINFIDHRNPSVAV